MNWCFPHVRDKALTYEVDITTSSIVIAIIYFCLSNNVCQSTQVGELIRLLVTNFFIISLLHQFYQYLKHVRTLDLRDVRLPRPGLI